MGAEEVPRTYPRSVVERAMKVQEVILRALAGQLTWIQAAESLGCSPRTIQRLRWRLEHVGYDGLFDRRRHAPSPKRAPVVEVQRVLTLYRDRYQGFNVRHFHQLARREHSVRFCYAFVKKALQTAGLVSSVMQNSPPTVIENSPPLPLRRERKCRLRDSGRDGPSDRRSSHARRCQWSVGSDGKSCAVWRWMREWESRTWPGNSAWIGRPSGGACGSPCGGRTSV